MCLGVLTGALRIAPHAHTHIHTRPSFKDPLKAVCLTHAGKQSRCLQCDACAVNPLGESVRGRFVPVPVIPGDLAHNVRRQDSPAD